MFNGRFDGNVPQKGNLPVRLISDKVHCKVEFRDAPDTTGKNNLLSTLNLRFSSASIDHQVSRVFKLLSETDWKNLIFYRSSSDLYHRRYWGAHCSFWHNERDMRGEN